MRLEGELLDALADVGLLANRENAQQSDGDAGVLRE